VAHAESAARGLCDFWAKAPPTSQKLPASRVGSANAEIFISEFWDHDRVSRLDESPKGASKARSSGTCRRRLVGTLRLWGIGQVFKEPSRLAGRQCTGSNLAERAAIFIKNFGESGGREKVSRKGAKALRNRQENKKRGASKKPHPGRVASEERCKAGGGEVLVVGEGFGEAEASHDGEGDAVDDAGAVGKVLFV
jgi:hypothetical protein